jgi:hypothetical protein
MRIPLLKSPSGVVQRASTYRRSTVILEVLELEDRSVPAVITPTPMPLATTLGAGALSPLQTTALEASFTPGNAFATGAVGTGAVSNPVVGLPVGNNNLQTLALESLQTISSLPAGFSAFNAGQVLPGVFSPSTVLPTLSVSGLINPLSFGNLPGEPATLPVQNSLLEFAQAVPASNTTALPGGVSGFTATPGVANLVGAPLPAGTINLAFSGLMISGVGNAVTVGNGLLPTPSTVLQANNLIMGGAWTTGSDTALPAPSQPPPTISPGEQPGAATAEVSALPPWDGGGGPETSYSARDQFFSGCWI